MSVPDPDVVMQTLQPLWTPLYGAFERGTQVAREFFDHVGRSPAPWVYPDLVRYEALTVLKQSGIDCDAVDAEILGLANHGLQIRFAGFTIRGMKALQDGSVPGPGPSRSKKDFFRQLSLGTWGEEIRNLVLLWQPDANHNLAGLSLVCPKDGAGTKAEAHWHVPIPHPAMATSTTTGSLTLVDEDLDISIDKTNAVAGGSDEEE